MTPALAVELEDHGRREDAAATDEARQVEARLPARPRALLDGQGAPGCEPLDDDAAVGSDVARAAREHRVAGDRVHAVQEIAREEHAVEAPLELEHRDVGEHLLGAAHVLQHLGGVIHSHDGVPEREQGVSDAPRAASEIEHRRAGRNGAVHDRRLVSGGEARVELDRAAVRCVVAGCVPWPEACSYAADRGVRTATRCRGRVAVDRELPRPRPKVPPADVRGPGRPGPRRADARERHR